MRSVVFSVVCVFLIVGAAAAEVPQRDGLRGAPFDRVVEMDSVRVPQTIDRAVLQRERENLHAWLMAEQVVAGIETPISVELTAEELEDIEFGVYREHLK